MSYLPANPSSPSEQYTLEAWLHDNVRYPGTDMRCRLRCNILNILYEGDPLPDQQAIAYHVLQKLNTTDINRLEDNSPGQSTSESASQIYQVWLYGRSPHQKKTAWTFHINLDQLGHYLHHFSTHSPTRPPTPPPTHLPTSFNQTAAIARHLSEILNRLGVSVAVRVKTLSQSSKFQASNAHHPSESHSPSSIRSSASASGVSPTISFPAVRDADTQRLLVFCKAAYNPSPSLIAEPIARQLRSLNLTGFKDAILSVKVQGEEKPEWSLRIDLTPPDALLQEWARWGDVEAIHHLLEQALAPVNACILDASLKDTTLHLVCKPGATPLAPDDPPESAEFRDSAESWDTPHHSTLMRNGSEQDAPIGQPPSDPVTPEENSPEPNASETSLAEAVTEAVIEAVSSTALPPEAVSAKNNAQDGAHDNAQDGAQSNAQDGAQDGAESHPEQNAISTSAHPQNIIRARVQTLLDSLSPQGIQSVVLYGQPDGQRDNEETPLWVEHLTLATSTHPEMGIAPLTLAQQGNLEAIAYLLSRLLNPDLSAQLETGGIRVQLLTKARLLHVMCSALVCPDGDEVAPKIIGFLKDIQHPDMIGVRIYGRRSGVRSPLWSRGKDFVVRPRFVPTPAAEFSASDAYVQELIGTPTDESPLRKDLTSEELLARWSRFSHTMMHRVRRSLLQTQLVALTPDAPTLAIPSTIQKHGLKTAAVWAAVGLLAVVQVDWLLGAIGRNASQHLDQPEQAAAPSVGVAVAESPDTLPFEPPEEGAAIAPIAETPPSPDDEFVDNNISVVSELTNPDMEGAGTSLLSVVPGSAAETLSAMQAELLTQSPYPTFNSNQLDLKLAMYYQHVAEFGPPDVLIIGSSRALRGIDPVVLEDALTDLGYDNADVFNFGINGATAQVVELVVHRILDPTQLPQMILWADGARAFNGGREDRTYEGIAASEGYQLLSQGGLSVPVVNGDVSQVSSQPQPSDGNWLRTFSQTLTRSYGELDDWLSDRLATVSTAHTSRDAIKAVIQNGLTGNVSADAFAFGEQDASQAQGQASSSLPENVDVQDADDLERVAGQIGIDGFLPLDVRFDPVTYYETYARVPGNYDRDYANFQISGQQAEALQTLLQLGDTHDVPIVFINLPLTEEYLDPYRLEHEQEFRQHLLSLDLNYDQFIFRDLSELWLTEDENGNPSYYQYFSDPSHLNQYGAVELSRRLAQDPMIPWHGSEF